MGLENTVGKWPSQPEAGNFVVMRGTRPYRFSQRIVCHLLAFIEATLTGAIAALLLSNSRFGTGDIHYAISCGIAIGAIVLLVIFLSGGATYDRFASRLSVLAAALTGATLIAAAVAFGGRMPIFTASAATTLFITVIFAKTLAMLLRNWLKKRGHLMRLVAVAADDPVQRTALVDLLSRRDDIELVFAGTPAQFDILDSLTQSNELDEVVLSGHQANEENIAALAGLAVTLVRVTPQDRLDLNAFDPIWGKKLVFSAWGAPASIIALPPLRGWRGVAKRLIDIMGSLTAILILSPVLIACAVAVKLDSRGPILFVQDRAGYRNRRFHMLKFRSMCSASADLTGSQLTLRNDSRVTRIGAFLRRTSADELPQLFNVLKGDMSLVGPRPHPKGARAGTVLYDDLIPHFYSRYRMKPGITGLAQVCGLRGNTETEQHLIDRFGRDLQYAAEWTPILDVAILFRTISRVFKDANAF